MARKGISDSQDLEEVKIEICRRWCVLTPLYLLTFKEPHRYESPTECVSLQRIQGLGVCDQ